MRSPQTILTTFVSLAVTVAAALLLPILLPAHGMNPIPHATWLPIALILALVVFAAQSWRVAIRGARGDVSISMAIDVATMLLLHPFVAAAGSALGTALYHLFRRAWKEHRVERAIVRGIVTFAAVALGGWLFHILRSQEGPLVFGRDWLALAAGICLRLAIRVLFYPLTMAALRPEPVTVQLRHEWEHLPLVPFLLTTTLGALAALIYQTQPAAIILLFGPLAATWAATREFSRLNELLATLEDKVADRTARLAETLKDQERRIAEFQALNAVGQAMVQALHPDEVLAVIAEESVKVTGADTALVTLLSDDWQHQFVRAAYGRNMHDYVNYELPIAGNLSGLVIRTGEVQVSTDPPNDPRLNQDMVQSGKWQYVIEAPLRSKDRVAGVLVTATDRPFGFDEQHIRLLRLFANQAGLFLENARLHEQSREVAVLEERNRLARELHDSVTQVLFSLTLNLEAAGGVLSSKPEKAAVLITRSGEMAAEALAEMRSLIFELRPAALQEKGLAAALTNHINLFRRRQGIHADLNLEGEGRPAPEVEFCLYRVAQEALTNAAKHAKASRVVVTYNVQPDCAVLQVEDNGVGFTQTAGDKPQSFGMIGMHERVAQLSGMLKVESMPGKGTIIQARIPITNLATGGISQ